MGMIFNEENIKVRFLSRFLAFCCSSELETEQTRKDTRNGFLKLLLYGAADRTAAGLFWY